MKVDSAAVGVLIRDTFKHMPTEQVVSFLLNMVSKDYVQHLRERIAMGGPHECPGCSIRFSITRGGRVVPRRNRKEGSR